jgi:hypothetical protein
VRTRTPDLYRVNFQDDRNLLKLNGTDGTLYPKNSLKYAYWTIKFWHKLSYHLDLLRVLSYFTQCFFQ